MESITKKFSKAFDVTDSQHVLWFAALHDSTHAGEAPDTLMTKNPFGIKVSKDDVLEWVNVMFSIAMKYSVEVVKGRAWVPRSLEGEAL